MAGSKRRCKQRFAAVAVNAEKHETEAPGVGLIGSDHLLNCSWHCGFIWGGADAGCGSYHANGSLDVPITIHKALSSG